MLFLADGFAVAFTGYRSARWLAEVANETIVQAGCDSVGKLIKQIYPSLYSTPEELKLTVAELQSIAAANPQLAQCAMALVAAA